MRCVHAALLATGAATLGCRAPAARVEPGDPVDATVEAAEPRVVVVDASVPAVVVAEPDDAETPAMAPLPLCDPESVDRVLRGHARDPFNPDAGSATVVDLEPTPDIDGAFGQPGAGPGWWGDRDVDGDGKPDEVRTFTTVDYWLHFLLVKRGPCFVLAGAVPGYQARLVRARGPSGYRDVQVLTYPLQGRLATYVHERGGYRERPGP